MMRLGLKGLAVLGVLCKVFALSVVLTLAFASAALADQVTNRIDDSPDATLENVTLNEGATQNATFRVEAQGSDGDNGCNIDSGEQLTVALSSSNPSVATLSPQTIAFTRCGQPGAQSVTVTALARGTATITAAPALNTTGIGTFDYVPASFTVTVNGRPTISDISDQTTDEDTPTGDISFTVGDAETLASSLTVTGSSSNTTLVPNSNVSLGGSGANRTVKVTPAANRSGTATITVGVSDGLAINTDTFVLAVNPVNDPPDIDLNGGAAGKDHHAVFTEDNGPRAIVSSNNLTLADIDSNNLASATVTLANRPDGNAESLNADTSGTTIAKTYDSATGELRLTGVALMADYQKVLRTVTYDNASQNPDTTDRSVTFVGSDGTADSNAPTSTVQVNSVNDAPTVTLEGDGTAEEGQTKTYDFTVSDPDSGDAFAIKDGLPACGTGGTLLEGSLDTTQNGGSFRCRFPDGPATSTVRIQVADSLDTDSNVATKDVEVNNAAPWISLSGPGTVEEGDTRAYAFTVTDPGDDTHDIITACGDNGNEVADSETYDPDTREGSFRCRFPDGPATSSVSARVTDSDGASDSDNRVVVVTVDNIAPVARDDAYNTDEDEPLEVSASGVLGNDEDAAGGEDPLVARLVGDPSNGTLMLNDDGSFTYEPDANFNGTDSFTYKANDGTEDGNNATVTVTVIPVNDKPSFIKGEDPNVAEDSGAQEFPGWATDISAGPANELGQTVRFEISNVSEASSVSTTSSSDAMFSEGPEVSSDGTLTFTPADNASGEMIFAMRLMDDGGRDGGGEDASDEQRFKVTISPENDRPTVELIGGANRVGEGGTRTYVYKVEDVDAPDPIVESCGARGRKIDTPPKNSFKCFFPDGPATSIVSVVPAKGARAERDEIRVRINNVAPSITLKGPSEARLGQIKTYRFTIDDPGRDNFSFATGFPKCDKGNKIMGEEINPGGGNFRCVFVEGPARATVELRVKDSDGDLSNEPTLRVTVLPFDDLLRDVSASDRLEGERGHNDRHGEGDIGGPDAQGGMEDDPNYDASACDGDPDNEMECR